MATPRKPARPATSTVRFREEDWKLIDDLRNRTGVSSLSDLLRLALRALDKKERK